MIINNYSKNDSYAKKRNNQTRKNTVTSKRSYHSGNWLIYVLQQSSCMTVKERKEKRQKWRRRWEENKKRH